MAAMSEAEEELLLSCLMSAASSPPYIYPHMSQGEGAEMAGGEGKAPRRRRRKPRRGGDGSAAEAKKRRLSDEQVRFLETSFGAERKLESGRKVQLAAELGLDPKQVAVWFQNRRSRWKNKQLEEEFVHLKSAHHQAILEKCQLEKEVLMLKEKLSTAEEEVKKLTTSSTTSVGGEKGGGGGGSPCSSFSKGTYQPFFGELEADGVPALLYMDEYGDMMDWGNFYGI